jgi:hypothetical protein
MDLEIDAVAVPSVRLSSGQLGVAEFALVSGLLTASISEDGVRSLRGTASSTIIDLHGDEMTKSALEDMERSANAGLTIFLNHKYDVPEDIGGSVTDAKMVKRKNADGVAVWDLDFGIEMDDSNPRAIQLHNSIMGVPGKKKGTKLGLSIGAMIPEDGAKRRKDGSYLIEHINLLETSLVGIPANPRSWVQNAVKSIKDNLRGDAAPTDVKGATAINMSSPKLTLDPETRMYRIEGSFDGMDLSAAGGPDTEKDLDLAEGDTVLAGEDGVEVVKIIDPGAQAAADLVDPEVQDAKITLIEIDTGSDKGSDSDTGSQEAPESNPENEAGLADETAEGDDEALGDDVTRSLPGALSPEVSAVLGQTVGLLNKTIADLIEARKELAVEKTARMAAEADSKLVREQAGAVIRSVSEVVDKIARTPLKSRTQFVEAEAKFAHLKDVYGEEFLKMLEGTSDGKR